jgi:CRISPR-associated endoribonuclease Cas6
MRPSAEGLRSQGRSLSFFVGAAEAEFAVAFAQGLHAQPEFSLPSPQGGLVDVKVQSVQLMPPPNFQQKAHRFRTASPVLLKHKRETHQIGKNSSVEYLTYQDGPAADAALTASLHRKLHAAGLAHLAPHTKAEFCRQYPSPKTKLIAVEKGPGLAIKCRATACPVWVTGPQEALQLVWAAGIGGSTGIGFGSVDC